MPKINFGCAVSHNLKTATAHLKFGLRKLVIVLDF